MMEDDLYIRVTKRRKCYVGSKKGMLTSFSEFHEVLGIGGYDPSCLLCQEAEESLEHLTLKCPFSWVVWLKEIGGATQSLNPSSSFLQWSSFIANLLGSSNCSSHLNRRFFLSQVANFIWAIWKERNGVLFEGSLPSVLRACQYVSKLQNDSLLLQKQPEQCSEQKRSVQVIWRKPVYPYVKVNFDGAYRYHSKEAAIGGIARDSQGRFIAAFSSTVEATSSIQAEAFAALEAIRLAVALEFKFVIIEGNSQVLINLLKDSSSPGPWKISAAVSIICSLLCNFLSFDFLHVFWEGN